MINEQIVYFRKGMEAVSMNQVDVLELKSLIFEKKIFDSFNHRLATWKRSLNSKNYQYVIKQFED